MGIYSKDLRFRAVAAVEQGIPSREVVETFSISLTTLKRWLRMSREGKDLLHRAPPREQADASSQPSNRRRLCGASSKRTTRGYPGAPPRTLGAQDGRAGVDLHHEPNHTKEAGVELQKKTRGATERDQEVPSAFRERLTADCAKVDPHGNYPA